MSNDFKTIEKKNKEKARRLKEERLKANKKVEREYGLRRDGVREEYKASVPVEVEPKVLKFPCKDSDKVCETDDLNQNND